MYYKDIDGDFTRYNGTLYSSYSRSSLTFYDQSDDYVVYNSANLEVKEYEYTPTYADPITVLVGVERQVSPAQLFAFDYDYDDDDY